MQTKTTNTRKANGTTVQSTSFKSILNEMMKLTKGGNIKVANKHWDIYYKQSANNTTYTNYNTGA